MYVGSSKNIYYRWQTHKRQLRNNTHLSKYMQNAWNKYGESTFIFSILEECEVNELIHREQFWLDRLQPKFNTCKIAYNNGGLMLGRKQSPEAIEKMRRAKLGKKHTLEHIEKVRQSQIGSKRSEETKQRLSEKATERYANRICRRGHVVSGKCKECHKIRIAEYEDRLEAQGKLVGQNSTACKYGHDLTIETNRYINGGRVYCHICALARAKKQREDLKK